MLCAIEPLLPGSPAGALGSSPLLSALIASRLYWGTCACSPPSPALCIHKTTEWDLALPPLPSHWL